MPSVYIMSCCDSSLKLTCRGQAQSKDFNFTLFLVFFLIFLFPPFVGGTLEKNSFFRHSFSLYIYCIVSSDFQIHRDVFDATLKDNLNKFLQVFIITNGSVFSCTSYLIF